MMCDKLVSVKIHPRRKEMTEAGGQSTYRREKEVVRKKKTKNRGDKEKGLSVARSRLRRSRG